MEFSAIYLLCEYDMCDMSPRIERHTIRRTLAVLGWRAALALLSDGTGFGIWSQGVHTLRLI